MTSLQQSQAWHALQLHQQTMSTVQMRDLFAHDPQRFNSFHLKLDDVLFDYSKHRINADTLKLLFALAREAKVEPWRDAMLRGDKINITEGRAVLHTALRNRSPNPVLVDGQDVMPAVRNVLRKMRLFSEQVRNTEWRGFSGKPITDVINIGIGGSDLGPAMVCDALQNYAHPTLKVHFVSNIDGAHLMRVLKQCVPETTLVIIASKTFTTQETMINAHSARTWFLQAAQHEKYISQHFVALSTNRSAVIAFGINPDHMFEFWDWVGGRYSLWSAVGLSIALYIGMDNFESLLEGGFVIDEHFRNAPLEANMPVIMALLGVWYHNFLNICTHAILPYDQGLARFPAYLQQAEMESNGKFINRQGERVTYTTCPVVWGEAGTNGQHAFYQLIHQGTQIVASDFMMPIRSHYAIGKHGVAHHKILLANLLAQTRALMLGKTEQEARADLEATGMSGAALEALLPHRTFEGNRPSSVILVDKLTPKTLGKLIATYEHKIFVQGVIWNINSYDQWGVEYGKQITQQLLPQLQESKDSDDFDSSTNALLRHIKARCLA